jgi:hypothetical protein
MVQLHRQNLRKFITNLQNTFLKNFKHQLNHQN